MRYVDRTKVAAPASLTGNGCAGERELGRAKVHYNKIPRPNKSYPFDIYKSNDVKFALHDLFHGKCAYCEIRYEGSQPVDVEHYRPKGGVEECPDHSGYWWLAATWSNLLPSCIDCNRRRGQISADVEMTVDELAAARRKIDDAELGGKHNAFPMSDDNWVTDSDDPVAVEKPLLIDPTRTDPKAYFEWPKADISVVLPKEDCPDAESPCASTSINIYALNRIGLVQSRLEVRQDLEAHIHLIRSIAIKAMEAEGEARTTLLGILETQITDLRKQYENPGHAFSTMLGAHIDAFEAELVTLLAEG
jgi:uncharacterized protein (TIGR02646 family)